VIEPEVAVTTDVPTLTPVASPLESTVATAVVAELQVTEDKAFEEPSLYVPVAEN
jgi:hypothetical protein